MEANPRRLYELLYAGNQFVIPVFQRKYVWKKPNWERLWDDIQALRENGGSDHFMGSIVTSPYRIEPGTIPQYIVIDGQQRMITLVALLAAIRDEARLRDAGTLPEQIQKQYLTHEFATGATRYKVFPRLLDRDAFFALVDGTPSATDGSGMTDAYRFFRSQIAAVETEPVKYVTELFATVTQQLAFVSITLDADQNPWAIFETLNARGVALQQSDLIRNHMFMRVPLDEQDQFDEDHWRPFEEMFDAGSDGAAVPLEDFYRDFLMRDGEYVRPENTYLAFQADPTVRSQSAVNLTATLADHARCYAWIHRPRTAPDPEVGWELSLLGRLNVTASYPVVLSVLWRYAHGLLARDDAVACIRALQAFYIRRAVCGWSAGAYNRTLPAALPKLEADDYAGSLVCYLAGRGWPSDEEFADALLVYPLYRRFLRVARVLLLALEDPGAHKEQVDVEELLDAQVISIEHVMPQTIRADANGLAWQEMLGPEWESVHATWLHSIGNLSLTGYNTELSNSAYPTKLVELKKSNLQLNKWFTDVGSWDEAAIRKRGLALTEKVVELWPSAVAMDPAAEGVLVDEVEGAPGLSWAELEPLYEEFWGGFAAHLSASAEAMEVVPSGNAWSRGVRTGLEWLGVSVMARDSGRDLTVQASSYSGATPTLFRLLQQHAQEIEQAVHQPLYWVARDESAYRALEVHRNFDARNKSKWPEQYAWLQSSLLGLTESLMPWTGRDLPKGEQRQWTDQTFFDELRQRCPAAEKATHRLVEWCVSHDLGVDWGNWSKAAIFSVRIDYGEDQWTRLLRVHAENAIAVLFNYFMQTPAFTDEEKRRELLRRLNAIPPIEFADDVIDGEPWVPLTVLDDPDVRASFLEVMGWAAGQIRG